MKPTDFLDLIGKFDRLWADQRLTLEAKVTITDEIINSVPPLALCKNAASARAAAIEIMQQTVVSEVKNDRAKNETRQEGSSAESTEDKAKVDGEKRSPAPKKAAKGKRRS